MPRKNLSRSYRSTYRRAWRWALVRLAIGVRERSWALVRLAIGVLLRVVVGCWMRFLAGGLLRVVWVVVACCICCCLILPRVRWATGDGREASLDLARVRLAIGVGWVCRRVERGCSLLWVWEVDWWRLVVTCL